MDLTINEKIQYINKNYNEMMLWFRNNFDNIDEIIRKHIYNIYFMVYMLSFTKLKHDYWICIGVEHYNYITFLEKLKTNTYLFSLNANEIKQNYLKNLEDLEILLDILISTIEEKSFKINDYNYTINFLGEKLKL